VVDLGPRRPRGRILYLTLVTSHGTVPIQIRLEGELAEARVLYETIGRFAELTTAMRCCSDRGGRPRPDAGIVRRNRLSGYDYMVMHRCRPDRGSGVAPENGGMPGWPDIYFGVPQVANQAAWIPGQPDFSAPSLGVRNLACVPLQHRGPRDRGLFVGTGGRPVHGAGCRSPGAFAHHAASSPWRTRVFSARQNTKEYLENLIASSVTPS